MFLRNILVAINKSISVILFCQSKVNPIKREKVFECIYLNVTNHQDHLYLVENGTMNYFSHKKLKYFSASKPNIATLPCYAFDTRLFDHL